MTKRRRKRSPLASRVTMLSVRQIAKRYGFHPNTVYNWVNRDGLPAVRHGPGGKILVRQDQVEAFIKQWYEADED